MFREVGVDLFRDDISSTELRNRSSMWIVIRTVRRIKWDYIPPIQLFVKRNLSSPNFKSFTRMYICPVFRGLLTKLKVEEDSYQPQRKSVLTYSSIRLKLILQAFFFLLFSKKAWHNCELKINARKKIIYEKCRFRYLRQAGWRRPPLFYGKYGLVKGGENKIARAQQMFSSPWLLCPAALL